jgi:hypothetical protein
MKHCPGPTAKSVIVSLQARHYLHALVFSSVHISETSSIERLGGSVSWTEVTGTSTQCRQENVDIILQSGTDVPWVRHRPSVKKVPGSEPRRILPITVV